MEAAKCKMTLLPSHNCVGGQQSHFADLECLWLTPHIEDHSVEMRQGRCTMQQLWQFFHIAQAFGLLMGCGSGLAGGPCSS